MKIPSDGTTDRLDAWLARLAQLSRTEDRRRIEAGSVYVDGSRCRIASRRVGPGVSLRLEREEEAYDGAQPEVIFRDELIGILFKPPGMPVQATRSTVHGTLEAWLRSEPGVDYCAFHHRLDRDAQGLISVALDRRANRGLAQAFSARRVRRSYRALVHGTPSEEGGRWHHLQVQRGPRRTALPWTEGGTGEEMDASWQLSASRGPHALLDIQLVTGRTHQIRLQAVAEGHPIVGDRLYGFGESCGLRLQACSLELVHPGSGELVSWALEEPVDW
ncbi:MAG: RluA family pseudouridine synthase [Myxococcota bacterium]|nr:RluA family pseudouridine synthase [Myxococcota bacterium]